MQSTKKKIVVRTVYLFFFFSQAFPEAGVRLECVPAHQPPGPGQSTGHRGALQDAPFSPAS